MIARSSPGRESEASRRPASFHGRIPANSSRSEQMRRPESHPELLRRRTVVPERPISTEKGSQRLTKLLLNVMIQRSLGPVHVVMSLESTVADLIKVALDTYAKEGRRPLLTDTDPQSFELHYSQFSLESLNPSEKLIELGSRNFFLCNKPNSANSCSNEANKSSKAPCPWFRFFNFLL